MKTIDHLVRDYIPHFINHTTRYRHGSVSNLFDKGHEKCCFYIFFLWIFFDSANRESKFSAPRLFG